MKILVIDNNENLLSAIVAFLKDRWPDGIVDTARSREAAVTLIRALTPNFYDCILVDWMINGMTVAAWVPVLRELCPFSGIIIISAHEEEAVRMAVFKTGVDDFVPKSQMVRNLVAAIIQTARFRGGVGRSRLDI